MFSDVPGSVWNERHRHIPVRPFRGAWGLSNHQRARLLLGWRNEPVAGAMRLGQRPEQPLGMPLKNRRDIYRVSSVPVAGSTARSRREAMPISVSILLVAPILCCYGVVHRPAAAVPDGLKRHSGVPHWRGCRPSLFRPGPTPAASRLLPCLSQSPSTLPRYWGTDEEESPLLKGERANER